MLRPDSKSMKACSIQLTFLSLLILSGCYGGSRPRGIGRVAEDFSVQDSEHQISLGQFRGQIVVLNFWASWCPPCISETPSLVNMQRRLQEKGVIVVAVSEDEDDAAYRRFIRNYGVNFVTVRDPSQRVKHLYGTIKIPETYIIDRKGILRRKLISDVDWNSPEVIQFLMSL
jgi:cytochrome c biogenesis protein CcmG, thiol:disulfide interchange protein DsbE